MNIAALTFHRQLLRLAKGAVLAYERYLKEEESLLTVEILRERQLDLSKAPPEKKVEPPAEGL